MARASDLRRAWRTRSCPARNAASSTAPETAESREPPSLPGTVALTSGLPEQRAAQARLPGRHRPLPPMLSVQKRLGLISRQPILELVQYSLVPGLSRACILRMRMILCPNSAIKKIFCKTKKSLSHRYRKTSLAPSLQQGTWEAGIEATGITRDHYDSQTWAYLCTSADLNNSCHSYILL